MSAYRKGRRFEYQVRDELKAMGCDIVSRTAKSGGPFDLVGIDTTSKTIRFVQCKAGKDQHLTKKETEALRKLHKGIFTTFALRTVKIGKVWELKGIT